ncbi:GNAT family N-acetyltransferase [Daejeonella oryzae]|uniref:GNAT family N-acetyltransferase n=1 Tax=Daejeonella oryzae TaxID=1122943 RepID=UPI00040BC624|nr:GNAT family N-acetyltransferase [Daejeonella oryzae]
MEIEIIDYQPGYKDDFRSLNIEWISQYFEPEPLDFQQLDHPEEYIIDNGGKIYFARSGTEIIGTVSLKKVNNTVFELSKMAVSPRFQGMGTGRLLGEHVIKEAKKLGCKLLFLESNKKLVSAIKLYEKLGFIEVQLNNSPYSRSDFRAEMVL